MPPPIIWNLSDCDASSLKCWDWHTGKSRIHHAGTIPPTYWSHVVVWDLCETSNLNGDSHLAFPFRVSDLHRLCEVLDVWLTHEGREGVWVPSSSLCLVIPLPRMPFYPHCSANSIHLSEPFFSEVWPDNSGLHWALLLLNYYFFPVLITYSLFFI